MFSLVYRNIRIPSVFVYRQYSNTVSIRRP
ncbi:hypothetical protein HID58_073884 [Brassica napus]|uniref:Uncharacterized protein n=1 Tax=Brassica napus TaxID=3708 RepID=A0ABQ7YGX7_BRANA|nr:hypothetical protein HID58_073884 [Brassica napus]